jgi:hypothetical protein
LQVDKVGLDALAANLAHAALAANLAHAPRQPGPLVEGVELD